MVSLVGDLYTLIRTLMSLINKVNHGISIQFITMYISYIKCNITTLCNTTFTIVKIVKL